VAREWPGNATPVLKGSKENIARLDHLVDALMVDCTYNVPSLPEACFGPKAMKAMFWQFSTNTEGKYSPGMIMKP